MSDIAISVEGIGKMYRLAHEAQRSASFRELITNTALGPFRRLKALRGEATADTEEFWALKDVSFQVPKGQVVGIIGRNGAGKSTLLKVLSRIVEPTEGRAVMHGRVASLLEVGTGFHPELTGRENIYLNGSILGMRKREIDRKFDEIVAFAEVEKFLDTPVKRYSSGMYVRLAFAVAAHLDPEILIVDEVLAVGDAEFQKKCIGKMQDVAKGGDRTVLFVSHNMAAVTRLCTRGVCLKGGTVALDGTAEAAAAFYAAAGRGRDPVLAQGKHKIELTVQDAAGTPLQTWARGQTAHIIIRHVQPTERPLACDLALYSESGIRVVSIQSDRASTASTGASTSGLRFAIVNTNIKCQELSLDLGLREPGSNAYEALWSGVLAIPISGRDDRPKSSADALIDLPCEVSSL